MKKCLLCGTVAEDSAVTCSACGLADFAAEQTAEPETKPDSPKPLATPSNKKRGR